MRASVLCTPRSETDWHVPINAVFDFFLSLSCWGLRVCLGAGEDFRDDDAGVSIVYAYLLTGACVCCLQMYSDGQAASLKELGMLAQT